MCLAHVTLDGGGYGSQKMKSSTAGQAYEGKRACSELTPGHVRRYAFAPAGSLGTAVAVYAAVQDTADTQDVLYFNVSHAEPQFRVRFSVHFVLFWVWQGQPRPVSVHSTDIAVRRVLQIFLHMRRM